MTAPARTASDAVVIAIVAAPEKMRVPAAELNDRRESHIIDVQTGCIDSDLERRRAGREQDSDGARRQPDGQPWGCAVPAQAAPQCTGVPMSRRQPSQWNRKRLRRAIQ